MGRKTSGRGFRERRNAQLPCSLEFVSPLREARWTSPTLRPLPCPPGCRPGCRPGCPSGCSRPAWGAAEVEGAAKVPRTARRCGSCRWGQSAAGVACGRVLGLGDRTPPAGRPDPEGERRDGGLGARPPGAPPRAELALPRGRRRLAARLPASDARGLHRSQPGGCAGAAASTPGAGAGMGLRSWPLRPLFLKS